MLQTYLVKIDYFEHFTMQLSQWGNNRIVYEYVICFNSRVPFDLSRHTSIHEFENRLDCPDRTRKFKKRQKRKNPPSFGRWILIKCAAKEIRTPMPVKGATTSK
jgi:hypothetical protein